MVVFSNVLSLYCMLHAITLLYTGLKFWKLPRRKVFAVPKSDLSKKKTSNSAGVSIDSDGDFQPPQQKKRKDELEVKIDHMRHEMEEIKDVLYDMMHLDRETKIPLSLRRIIRDAFKCKICLSVPINAPVIMTKCCKTILGCERCVNEWYSGEDALVKKCPSCRVERGYNETMILRGLDEFLLSIECVMDTSQESTHNPEEVASLLLS